MPVLPVALADTDRAKTLLTTVKGLGARDAVHAAVMLNNELSEIATFDEEFERLTGITRVPLN